MEDDVTTLLFVLVIKAMDKHSLFKQQKQDDKYRTTVHHYFWWRTWCGFRSWKVSKMLLFTCRSPYSTVSSTKQNCSSININGTRWSHSHNQANSCSPQQNIGRPHRFTVYSSKLSCGGKGRHGVWHLKNFQPENNMCFGETGHVDCSIENVWLNWYLLEAL